MRNFGAVRERWPARHVRGHWYVQGQLWLSDDYLAFFPTSPKASVVDRDTWYCNLADVESVSVANRRATLLHAGWARRVKVQHHTVADFFQVNRAPTVAATIHAARSSVEQARDDMR